MLEAITQDIFSSRPVDTLYHYTSLGGMLGIVDSGTLRVSDIRYMNDSAELRHTLDLMVSHVTQRIVSGTDHHALLNQLLEWLSHRIADGPMLFGASFRANGNLLSQWRGYSTHGKGVSLGFNPLYLLNRAERQNFQVARCIYDSGTQAELNQKIVDAIIALARDAEPGEARAGWVDIFEQIEGDVLRIAAVLKHPSFAEEQEWRLVSPVIQTGGSQPIHFREGTSMLVPYYAFDLSRELGEQIRLDHVFLGPTGYSELSMKSIDLFLAQSGASPKRGISYCQIPYRHR